MFIVSILRAAIAAGLIFTAGVTSADPAPGTPGNSGNGNPHGAPPGQGGTAPGNSGNANPHGTPPGQRIGGGGPAGGGVGSGSQAGPRTSAGFFATTGATHENAQVLAEGKRDERRWDQVFRRVHGWEPTWVQQTDGWDQAHVDATLAESQGGWQRASRVTWDTREGRVRGWQWLSDTGEHAWLRATPSSWRRWGQGPWIEQPTAVRGPDPNPDETLAMRIGYIWQVTPLLASGVPNGPLRIRFSRWLGKGNLEWEVEAGTGNLVEVTAFDADGRREWTETRQFTESGTRALLRERRRRYEFGREDLERSVWRVGPGTVAAEVVAVPPQ